MRVSALFFINNIIPPGFDGNSQVRFYNSVISHGLFSEEMFFIIIANLRIAQMMKLVRFVSNLIIMKHIFLFIALLLLCNKSILATHGMGGEITWTCSGSNYIFQSKFYCDCNGIPGPPSMMLQTHVPGIPTISMILISQSDIRPVGSDSSGSTPCPTCPGALGQSAGAVGEFIYKSAPVVLPGSPPVVNNNGILACLATGNYMYQWFLDRYAIAGANGPSYTPTVVGTYQVLIVDSITGDGNYSDRILVSVVGIDEPVQNILNFSVYPNPVIHHSFRLAFDLMKTEYYSVMIKVVLGKTVYTFSQAVRQGRIEKQIAHDLESGIYFIEIKASSGSITRKIAVL